MYSKVKNVFFVFINYLSKVEEVYFHFPRFEFEYSITLNDILKDMNMILAFSENADFSNINRTISLYVSEVIQRTYIKVTETGNRSCCSHWCIYRGNFSCTSSTNL